MCVFVCVCVCVCVCVSRCNGFTVIAKPLRLVNVRKSPVHMKVTGNSPNASTKRCVCVWVGVCMRACLCVK